MRSQKVSVDVWKMIISSCSYLLLAVLAWIFLRLVNACIHFPRYLKENRKRKVIEEKREEEEGDESKKTL